jgi:hypothetical protein
MRIELDRGEKFFPTGKELDNAKDLLTRLNATSEGENPSLLGRFKSLWLKLNYEQRGKLQADFRNMQSWIRTVVADLTSVESVDAVVVLRK